VSQQHLALAIFTHRLIHLFPFSFLAFALMSTPIRKKRNWKALQLDVAEAASPVEREPVPTRLAPTPAAGVAGGKKRPPPMTLKAPKIPNGTNGDTDRLSTPNGLVSALPTASASARRSTYHDKLSNTLANLDINSETKRFDLRNEDLKDLQELGQGNGGSVKKVEHIPTGTMMAKKVRDLIVFMRESIPIFFLLDCPYRCQAFSAQANSTRTADHA
jgi:hypothetical protein